MWIETVDGCSRVYGVLGFLGQQNTETEKRRRRKEKWEKKQREKKRKRGPKDFDMWVGELKTLRNHFRCKNSGLWGGGW